MSTAAERLAYRLIVDSMTIEEIAEFLGGTSTGYAKAVVTDMRRNVLPDLGAWCPRPTYDGGYVYRVLDAEPSGDSAELQKAGARAMHADNLRRLKTMLATSEPYLNVLDRRTAEGRRANVYVKAASAALASLELIESE